MSVDLEVKELGETQARLTRLVEEVAAGSGLAAILAKATLRAHRYATAIVHVKTGRLKNSLFPRVHNRMNQVYGVVGTNVIYARVEHERGGDHAYFQRTMDEDGPGILEMMEQDVKRAARKAGGE